MKTVEKKNFFWNMVGTSTNAFTSLFFMIIVVRINGVDQAGLFTFAFSTASLLLNIAMYSGRVYQVTERDPQYNGSDFFFTKIITCSIMLLASILFLVFKDYTAYKNFIILTLCIFKLLEGFTEVIYAYIQNDGKLYQVGISFTMKSVIGVVVFLLIDFFTKQLWLACLALIVNYIIIFLAYDLPNVRKVFKLDRKIRFDKVFSLLRLGFFTFAIAFLSLYILNAPKYAIDDLLSNDIQTIFGIIMMPATLIILIAQFILHPYLLHINQMLLDNNYKKLVSITHKLLGIILGTGVVVLLGSYFLGIPILNFVYNISLNEYLSSLMIVMLGSVFCATSTILSNILVAMRKTFQQFIIYILAAVTVFFLSKVFVGSFGIIGACVTHTAVMILISFLFEGVFLWSIHHEKKQLMEPIPMDTKK